MGPIAGILPAHAGSAADLGIRSVTQDARRPSLSDDALRWVLGGAALLLLGAYLWRYPVGIPLPEARDLVAPDVSKLWGALRAGLALGALNLAAAGVGIRVAAALQLPRRSGWWVPAVLGLGLLVLAYSVLTLAALHILTPAALAVLLLLCVAAGGRPLLQALRSAASTTTQASGWALVACAVLLLGPLLQALGPEPGWDALTYHLALPERYLHENGIVVTPFSVFSTFPAAVEMLFVFALAFDAQALANLLHLEFGVLSAWVVFAMARGASFRAGLLALAVLAADPLFVTDLGLAYNDLAACLYVLLAAALLQHGLEEDSTRWFIACGVFAGAAAAVRYTTWGLLPALLLLVWIPPLQRSPRRALRASVVVAASASIVVLPWLVRNLLFTGNPVAPALEGWFHAPGGEFYHPVALRQSTAFLQAIGMGRGFGDLLALPWNLTYRAEPGDYRAFAFQIGCLYLLGAGLALAGGRRARLPVSTTLLKLSLLLSLFWFFTSQEPRYLLPTLALLAVVGGIAGDALIPRIGLGRLWLALPLLAVVHAQLPSLFGVIPGYSWGLGSRGSVPEERQPGDVVGERLRQELGPQDRVLLMFEPRSFYFRGLDYVPYHTMEGPQLLQAIHDANRRNDLSGFFEGLGASHVLLNRNLLERFSAMQVPGYSPDELRSDLAALRRFLDTHTEPLLTERGIAVHRIRDGASEARLRAARLRRRAAEH